jgi:hypothetical protein
MKSLRYCKLRVCRILGGLCGGTLAVWAVTWLVSEAATPAQTQKKDKAELAPLLYSGNETGSFKILFSGEEIGQEKFQIVEEASGVRATAEVRLAVERDNTKVAFDIRPNFQFSRLFEPISYQVVQQAGPNRTKAQVNFKPTMSEAVYDTGKETDTRQIQLKKDVLILDDNVFHHYIILAKRYDFSKRGVQEFSAFVPQQFIAGGVSVSDKGMETVQLGNKNLRLQHLLVDTGELQISLWLTEKGDLLKLAVPKSSVEVVRE